MIDLGLSMNFVSVNAALHFMHLVPKDIVDIKMNLSDWSINIQKAKEAHLI